MTESVEVYFANLTRLEGVPFPLSRNVKHDPRSKDYPYATRTARSVVDVEVEWPRRIPHLNQAGLGSCTGNGGTSDEGTDAQGRAGATTDAVTRAALDEVYAVQLYSDATAVDGYQGTYPPDDTGSDALSIAKVLKTRGLIDDYTHLFSLDDAKRRIQDGPFMTGLPWLSGMFVHDRHAVVHVNRSDTVEGGHEPFVRGRKQYFKVQGDLTWYWKLDNYWVNNDGSLWGDAEGSFYLSDADYSWLLSQDGDATVLHWKVSVPAPEPTPTPVTPAPGGDGWFPPAVQVARLARSGARARPSRSWQEQAEHVIDSRYGGPAR